MKTAEKVSHTPGPWEIGYGRLGKEKNEDAQLITRIGPIGIDHNHWEGEYFLVSDEDARLIAAAPEMTDTLEEVDLRCTQAILAHDIGNPSKAKQINFLLGELRRIQSVAIAAIRKAKGEQ